MAIQCDDCGQVVALSGRETHASECPSAVIAYDCCDKRGPRSEALTHPVDCLFGCAPIPCTDRHRHFHDAVEVHCLAHRTLKRKLKTLQGDFSSLQATLAAAEARDPPVRRSKQAGELPSRFCVNTSLLRMVQYLVEGGGGDTGLEILTKTEEIFQHPTYSKNIQPSMLPPLLEALHTLIVDMFCYDSAKWQHVNVGFNIILQCLKVTTSRISKPVGQLLKGVMDTMGPEMMYRVRIAFFEVVCAAPYAAQTSILSDIFGLIDSHPHVSTSNAFFWALKSFLGSHKRMIVAALPRLAEAIKASKYSESYEFVKKLVDASTVDLCYTTGVVAYVAAHLAQPRQPQMFHQAALLTLRKVSTLNPALLHGLTHLLPDDF